MVSNSYFSVLSNELFTKCIPRSHYETKAHYKCTIVRMLANGFHAKLLPVNLLISDSSMHNHYMIRRAGICFRIIFTYSKSAREIWLKSIINLIPRLMPYIHRFSLLGLYPINAVPSRNVVSLKQCWPLPFCINKRLFLTYEILRLVAAKLVFNTLKTGIVCLSIL